MIGITFNARFLTQPLTGVQRYAAELIAALDRRMARGEVDRGRYALSLLAPRSGARRTALRHVRPRRAGWSGSHLWEQIELPALGCGDLLVSPCNTGPLAVRRQVVTIHDMSAFDCPETMSTRYAMWYRWLLPRLVRTVRHVITVSSFSRGRIIELTGIRPDKVTAIAEGVAPRFYRRDGDEIAAARRRLELPEGRYVLSVGSLEPRKNLRRLLAAWTLVKRDLGGDLTLVIAGPKGDPRIFRDASIDPGTGSVVTTGHLGDELLAAVYSGAAAMVYPSTYEGFGLPPLEAMACGAPVVVGDCASLPEVVGQAGVLVDPYDIAAIADGIRRVVVDESLARTLSARGLARAKSFTWDRTAELTWQVIAAACRDRPKELGT